MLRADNAMLLRYGCVQNTPHNLSKHSSYAGGMDHVATPSPPRSADGAAAAATAAMGASAAGNQGQAALPNGDTAAFRNRSTTGSAAGAQSFSAAGQCDLLLLASTTTNGGQYSAAGVIRYGLETVKQ